MDGPHGGRDGRPFFLLPSVGTWLQALPCVERAPSAAVASFAAVKVLDCPAPVKDAFACMPVKARQRGFGLKPSVATWLQPRFDQDPFAKTVEEPAWEADFESFLTAPKTVDEEPAPPVSASVEPGGAVFQAHTSRPPSATSGLFLLTPPPAPTSRCAVQTVPRAPDVLVLEGLAEETKPTPKVETPAEEKPSKSGKRLLSTTEELIGTNRAPDDDEELLLGDDAVGLSEGFVPRRPPGDGVDSASESDAGEQQRTAVASRAAPPPKSTPVPPSGGGAEQAQDYQQRLPSVDNAAPPLPPPAEVPTRSLPPTEAEASKEAAKPPSTSPPPKAGQAPAASAARPAAAPQAGQTPAQGAAWADVDTQVAKRLDNFFGDRNAWDRVTNQCQQQSPTPTAASPPAEAPLVRASFRVRVPAPHPGLQYRRSKHLGDRYQRYVENGSTVTGQVEDDGTWLRLSHNVFLPMRIDGNQVLEPLPAGQENARPIRSPSAAGNTEQLSWIWGWCTGCRDGQVMVDADILVRGDAPRAGAPPSEIPMSHTSR